jgi:hypothetical protein
MNRLLLAAGGTALLGLILFQFLLKTPASEPVSMICVALLIAALCAFGLFGSFTRPE